MHHFISILLIVQVASLTFSQKVASFRSSLPKPSSKNFAKIVIKSPNSLYNDTYNSVMKTVPEDLINGVKVEFVGQEVDDKGGPQRDVITKLAKEFKERNMFDNGNDGFLLLSSRRINDYRQFEFMGRIVAICLLNDWLIDVPFSFAVYNLLLSDNSKNIDYGKQLQSVDKELYHRLELLKFSLINH